LPQLVEIIAEIIPSGFSHWNDRKTAYQRQNHKETRTYQPGNIIKTKTKAAVIEIFSIERREFVIVIEDLVINFARNVDRRYF
jgi:hypothetical protein